jgi:O-antigen biosynthesis protein
VLILFSEESFLTIVILIGIFKIGFIMISIIIPFKDKVELLEKCLASILEKTSCQDYEVLLIDNQSAEKATLKYLETARSNPKIAIHKYDKPFNFSAMNNYAVVQTKGEYLLFLNNDTQVISENWLEEMLKLFEDEKVGAVGAKLLYPNGKIQHIGVEIHPEHGPIHTARMQDENSVDFESPRECVAVTGACLMTRKRLFLEAGGFDEVNLSIAYNDIDYCFKLRKLGYKIICTPDAKLFHHESASRGLDIKNSYKVLKSIKFLKFKGLQRYRQFLKEQEYLREKWL